MFSLEYEKNILTLLIIIKKIQMFLFSLENQFNEKNYTRILIKKKARFEMKHLLEAIKKVD
jgi:hypothetical protein